MKTLRGGEDAHSHRRLMNSQLAAQMAFCILVQFVAGLFVTTFERLAHKPLGFSPERVLILYTSSETKQPPLAWMQISDRLRRMPGVENAALAGWPLLEGDRWTGAVRFPGHAPEARGPYLLDVSPRFFATMGIGLIAGRELRPGDTASVGLVNQSFVRFYFDGRNPVGQMVDRLTFEGKSVPMQIVGLVHDAVYASLREPIRPTIYLPLEEKNNAAFLIRTQGDPLAFAAALRREVSQVRTDFRVTSLTTETNTLRWNMVRERLLATLSFFFAIVALVLAAVGLYGVLNYSVTCQRREIGIRMALGARPAHVVRGVTSSLFAVICLGAVIGLAGGLVSGRFIEALLFEVKSTDLSASTLPLLTLLAATVLAALPPALRAVRTDPANTLRSD
jgi:predicted permease